MCLFFRAPAWQFVICVCACAPFAEFFFFLQISHMMVLQLPTQQKTGSSSLLLLFGCQVELLGAHWICILHWAGRCFCCCVGSLMSHNQQAHLSSSRKLKSRFPAEFISICTVSTAKNTTSAYREQECVIINENMITTNKVSLLNSPNEKQVQLRPSKSEFSSFHPHQMCIMKEKSLKFRCCDLKSVIASGFKRSMNWLKRSWADVRGFCGCLASQKTLAKTVNF